MKLHIAILVLLTVIASIPWECQCDSSIQNAEEVSQVWEQGSDPEGYRDEHETDPEMSKKVRNRGGKRRRRLRQRPRTTEAPTDIDNVDELHTAASSIEGNENGEVPHRKRPSGKRRRRPLRRYHDNEQPGTRPRRRKGGRKRTRPQIINPDDIETTTSISIDYDSPATSKITHDDLTQTTESLEKHYKNDNSRYTNAEIINYKVHDLQINNSVQAITETNKIFLNNASDNKEENNELIVPQNSEEKIIQNQSEFGHKIFDRKNLFSTSRRLPETSATLRRRLIPRIKESLKNSTFDNNVRIIKPLANLESELESTHKITNEVITQQVSSSEFTAEPERIEPYQLINKIKSQVSKEINLEEPNYPKLDLFIRKNKTAFVEEWKESTTPTDYLMTTTQMYIETTTAQNEFEEEVKSTSENSAINNNPGLGLPNFDDEVFDLLKTEAGNSHLQRILEKRNMTLSELLDHRERGSRKFHLSDIFAKSKESSKPTNKETNNAEVTEEKIIETPVKFATENILSSSANFISESTPLQKNDPIQQLQNADNLEKDRSLPPTQHRESRIFDSLPEFTSTTKATVAEMRPYPTWRIIPNPKLKPVSIRGDYKEIKISNVLTTHKPFIENDIDKIYLLEERDNFIHHRNAATINSDGRENTFLFRKIPVSVKSAIVVSGAILVLAIFGFLSVLVSCRLRQKKARLRAKQDILCEHLQNDDFMASQQSLSPVLRKHNRGPVFTQGVHSNTTSNRHYYLWRTLRKTFQYD